MQMVFELLVLLFWAVTMSMSEIRKVVGGYAERLLDTLGLGVAS